MSEAPEKNEWLRPQAIFTAVATLGAFGSMWMSFDRRVTENQNNIASVGTRLNDHKAEEDRRLDRIETKLDRLIERGEK